MAIKLQGEVDRRYEEIISEAPGGRLVSDTNSVDDAGRAIPEDEANSRYNEILAEATVARKRAPQEVTPEEWVASVVEEAGPVYTLEEVANREAQFRQKELASSLFSYYEERQGESTEEELPSVAPHVPTEAGYLPHIPSLGYFPLPDDAWRVGEELRGAASSPRLKKPSAFDVMRYTVAANDIYGKMSPKQVEDDFARISSDIDSRKVDWASLVERQPVLKDVLLANKDYAPLVMDEAAQLNSFEWLFGTGISDAYRLATFQTPKGIAPAVVRKLTDSIVSEVTLKPAKYLYWWAPTEERKKRVEELEAKYYHKDYGARNFFTRALVNSVGMLPWMAADAMARSAGSAVGAPIGALAGATVAGGAGTVAGPGGAVGGGGAGAAVGAKAGAVAGGLLGSFAYNYYGSVGEYYWALSRLRDAAGNPLPEDVVRSYARGGAAASSVLMSAGLGAFTGTLGKVATKNPLLSAAVRKATDAVVSRSLVSGAMRNPMASAAASYGGHWLTGVALMSAVGAVDGATEATAKRKSGGAWGDVDVVEEMVASSEAAAKSAAQDFLLLSAYGPARAWLRKAGRNQVNADSVAFLRASAEEAREMRTAKDIPEVVTKLREKMEEKKGEAVDILVDAEDFVQLAQGSNVDPYTLAARIIPGGAERLHRAKSNGGSFAVPPDVVYQKIADGTLDVGMVEAMKVDADGMTHRGLRVQLAKQLADAESSLARRKGELSSGGNRVHKAVYESMRKAGIDADTSSSVSRLIAEASSTAAADMGLQVSDVARTIGLGRLAWLGPKGMAAVDMARVELKKQQESVPRGEDGEVSGTVPEGIGRIEDGRPELSDFGPPKGFSGRGLVSMRVGETGEPVSFPIAVLTKDKTTAIHETAHFLSWALEALSKAHPENQARGELLRTLREAMGYASAEERLSAMKEMAALTKKGESATTEEASRLVELKAKEEYFSHGFEKYLATGRAPSKQLQKVFSTFRKWVSVLYGKGIDGIEEQYRTLYGRDLPVSEEVRSAFDRMLATETAIQEAMGRTGTEALFKEYRRTLDKESQAKLDDKWAAATADWEATVAKLTDATLRDEAEAHVEGLRKQVTEEIFSEKRHRIQLWLESGSFPESEKDSPGTAAFLEVMGKEHRVNRDDAVRVWGAKQVAKMHQEYLAERKRGKSVSEMADAFGITDSELKSIMQGRRWQEVVSEEVRLRMEPRLAAAIQKIHEDSISDLPYLFLADIRLSMLRDLGAKIGVPASDLLTKEQAMDVARGTVEETAVRALKRTSNSMDSADRQHSERAVEFMKNGDLESSIQSQSVAFQNFISARVARSGHQEAEGMKKSLSRKMAEKRRRLLYKNSPEYMSLYNQVREKLGLAGESRDPKKFSLEELYARVAEDTSDRLTPMDFAPLARLFQKTEAEAKWGSLTLKEAREVKEASDILLRLASALSEIKVGAETLELDAVAAEAAATLKKNVSQVGKITVGYPERTGFSAFKESAIGLAGLLRNTESLTYQFDGGDVGGVFNKILVLDRLKSRDLAWDLHQKFSAKILHAFESVPKAIRKRLNEKVDVSSLGNTGRFAEQIEVSEMPRSSIMTLAMHWGNAGNRQRIRDGFGWNESQVSRLLRDTLTKEEWTFVQSIWKTLDELYPIYKEMHERTTGQKLGRVEPVMVETQFGPISGGYFPALIDKNFISSYKKVVDFRNVDQFFGPNFLSNRPDASASKERAEKNNQILRLYFDVVPHHIAQVIHDIAYREWTTNAGKFLLHPDVRAAIDVGRGKYIYHQLTNYVYSVANERADTIPLYMQRVHGFLQYMKSNMATAFLGANLPIVIPDATNINLAVTSGQIKARYAAAALSKIADFSSHEMSHELPKRAGNATRLLREYSNKISGLTRRSLGKRIREVAMIAQEFSDRLVSNSIWWGKYLEGKDAYAEKGFPLEKTEELAIRDADAVVRRMMPAFEIGELPPILRSKTGISMLVLFYGYMNKMFQMGIRTWDDASHVFLDPASTRGDKAAAAVRLAGRSLASAAVLGPTADFLMGRGPEDDESAVAWALRKTALAPVTTLPFVSWTVERTAKSLQTGRYAGGDASIRTAPALEAIVKSLSPLENVGKALRAPTDEKRQVELEKALEEAIGTVGLWVPLPSMAAKKGYQFIFDSASRRGRHRNRGAFDVANEAIYGRYRGEYSSPLTTLQTLLE